MTHTLSLSHLSPNSKMNTGRRKPSFYHMSRAAKACQPTFPLKTSKSLPLVLPFFSYERLLLDLRRVCTSCSLVWDRSHDFLPPWKTRCVDVRFPLIAAVLGLLRGTGEKVALTGPAEQDKRNFSVSACSLPLALVFSLFVLSVSQHMKWLTAWH